MSDKTWVIEPVSTQTIMDLLARAGIQEGQKVWIDIEPGSLSIRRDPVADLWGMIASSEPKSPRQMIDEAMDAECGLADDEEA